MHYSVGDKKQEPASYHCKSIFCHHKAIRNMLSELQNDISNSKFKGIFFSVHVTVLKDKQQAIFITIILLPA